MTQLLTSYVGASVVMAVLTLLLFMLSPLLGKRYRAKSIYLTWMIVLLGFLIPLRVNTIPPVTAMVLPAIREPIAAVHTPEDLMAAEDSTQPELGDTVGKRSVSTGSVSETVRTAGGSSLTWMHLIAAVWLAGGVAVLAFHMLRHTLFLRSVRRWRYAVANETTKRILKAEMRRMGIGKTVRLYHCPCVGSPMMVGLLRPMLLLPDEELTENELPFVFRHELVHLKRRDLLVKAGLTLACALHWFNPSVYLLIRQLNFWQENACDEAVISHCSMADKQFYTETIIRAIRRQVHVRSALTTTFYSGKDGMKRRITAIMESGGKHVGIVLCLVTLLSVFCLGMAFAIDAEPAVEAKQGALAYITRDDADGVRMLSGPSAGELELPLAAYFTGTQVVVTETTEGYALEEWNSTEGEDNWAHVLVGGDGVATGIRGWIPLVYLSDNQTTDLPTAVLTTDSPTDFVNVYARNDMESDVINTYQKGTEATLLGRVQQFYQIAVDGVYGFVPRDNLIIDEPLQARFDTFLPYRFNSIKREEYDRDIILQALFNERREKYNGLPVAYWSLEDKAWYGQMEETYIGYRDYYYQLPQEGDLSQDEAIDIAWNAFVDNAELPEALSRDNYDIYLGFYSIPSIDASKKRWEIRICPKGKTDGCFLVDIDASSGEVLDNVPDWRGVG